MFKYYRKVQYHETDKMGITHHANYIKWMEESRVAFLESINLPFQLIEEKGIVSPVASISIDYKAASTFGDEILVETTISKYSGVQFEIGYIMKNAETDKIVAKAVSKHCFIKNGKIISLKREEPEMHIIIENACESDF